jgi:hypothetical protein
MHRPSLIIILFVVGPLLWSGPTAADSYDDYIFIRDEIFFELDLPLAADDTNGIQARRERLRQLFWQVPPEFALDFYDELGTSDRAAIFLQRSTAGSLHRPEKRCSRYFSP